MQGAEEGQYVIQAFDPTMWSILDTNTCRAYVLGLTRLGNLMVQISLAEVSMHQLRPQYLTYLREVLVCNLQVSDLAIGYETLHFILQELQHGANVANPVELAVRLGADLHGQFVEWETNKAH